MSTNSFDALDFLRRIAGPCRKFISRYLTIVSFAFLVGLLFGFAQNEAFTSEMPAEVLLFPRFSAWFLVALVAVLFLLLIVPSLFGALEAVFGSRKSILAKVLLTPLVLLGFYVSFFVTLSGINLANAVGVVTAFLSEPSLGCPNTHCDQVEATRCALTDYCN